MESYKIKWHNKSLFWTGVIPLYLSGNDEAWYMTRLKFKQQIVLKKLNVLKHNSSVQDPKDSAQLP